MSTYLQSNQRAHEGMIPVEGAELYYREIGRGLPILILHGGPDFDHTYLLPDMDRLAEPFRLLYYDQRGRGKSAGNVQPEDVTIRSEIEDIEALREYFQLESVAVLGHSWGGVLGMEYAIRHPGRVSRLVLMNTAPASHDDFMVLQEHRRKRAAADIAKLKACAASAEYQSGDPDAVAEYYRSHFRATLRRPRHLETMIQRLRSSFTKEGIRKARVIEERLMNETWLWNDYNLLPNLSGLRIPTLIIHGDHDHIPVECAAHIARAIPGVRFVLLKDCGHFSHLECPDELCKEIIKFLQNN